MDRDEALAGRAAAGDEAAFELLVRRHQDAAWRYALSILRSEQEAEEAVQEAFVRAFRGIGTFRGESAFRTWLFAICRRVCSERLARPSNVVPIERAAREPETGEREEERIVIEQTLREMPEPERAAFALVDLLGFSREEAARAEGVAASTLKSRLYRARDRLARALLADREVSDEM